MLIAENIAKIEERIQKACAVSGRKREEITLMGVSKFHPIEFVEEAWQGGIRCFGESRVREGAEKFEGFREGRSGAELHLIGTLQRNKAKTAAVAFDCIQSLDRENLIGELAKCAGGKVLPVLLELHTGEESKSGFVGLDELFSAAELALGFSSLRPRGLMTMAPFTADTERIRASFRLLAKAQKELERRFPPAENWSCLSMGMSGDFEIAIQEGATLLRIGSAIFGERL
ncbi:YggS family pyridoxal phosphate enzyme [Spirochaetia bacterium]|nr:YggS family pyridoxal phosphate enzyme [Spirochaetia bacterium]